MSNSSHVPRGPSQSGCAPTVLGAPSSSGATPVTARPTSSRRRRGLAAAGFDVVALPGHSPTPLVAFTCRDLGTAAAIQITASHNPAGDNGYKLYGGIGTDVPGAQIVSPVDARIEALMAAAPPEIPCYPVDPDDHDWAAASRYLDRLATRFDHVDSLRIALTPMHGVGGRLAVEALANAGFDDVHIVDEQFAPDPDFPTVVFPNPEEPGPPACCWHWHSASTPTWQSPWTPTPTGAPSPSPTATAGASSPATRQVRSSATNSPYPALSSPAASCRERWPLRSPKRPERGRYGR